MKKIKFFTALMVIAIGFAACTSDSMEEVNKEASIDAKILAKILFRR